MKNLIVGFILTLTAFSTSVLANNNDVVNYRDVLQNKGYDVEVKEIRMKYFSPHCFGKYGVFQLIDGGYESFKMYPWGVIYYDKDGVSQFIDMVTFSQMTHPDTTLFIQVNK